MLSKVIMIVVQFLFAGIHTYYCLGPFQSHFKPPLAARAKMTMSRAQDIFITANVHFFVYINIYIYVFLFCFVFFDGKINEPKSQKYKPK